ncbi:type 2 periplasmic-binding domain-containing protein [Rickettsia conorii]|uniref:hypothetical protein n=1 Tax=Rickettsia conorii TaxID=781 RepID=UPI00226103A0|nr:hypothetical protein [Rickettsia conorii]UZW38397.1 hypothetical protein OSR38_05410 [Rickettsia conorii subsp. heilongjiangensis]
MDIELMNAIAAKIGINIEYNQDSWHQDQLDIQSGNADGATYTNERSCNGSYSQN